MAVTRKRRAPSQAARGPPPRRRRGHPRGLVSATRARERCPIGLA